MDEVPRSEQNPILPWFPLFVLDFSSDPKVEAMSTEAVGAYFLLLCKAWHQTPAGTIPADDATLARWSRLTLKAWQKVRNQVLAAFHLHTDGRYHQHRMENEFEKALATFKRDRERASAGGRAKARRTQETRILPATSSATSTAVSTSASSAHRSSPSMTQAVLGGCLERAHITSHNTHNTENQDGARATISGADGEDGGGDLEQRLRVFWNGNSRLPLWNAKCHAALVRIVELADWPTMVSCLDEALKYRAGMPGQYALTVFSTRQSGQQQQRTEADVVRENAIRIARGGVALALGREKAVAQ